MENNDLTLPEKLEKAATWIKNSHHTTAFTGSGISNESGIPTFRGRDGIWKKYDPKLVDIRYFHSHPRESWQAIKDIFYVFFDNVKPNDAHIRIAELEKLGLIKTIITQNIDNLHQEAGSTNVYEFHGTSRTLSCSLCNQSYQSKNISLETLPPRCTCSGILKPDFIFFGEPIPKQASILSFYEAQVADIFLVIGTTGQIMPACHIPILAKENGARIIEINPEPSTFTSSITDIYLPGKATEMMNQLFTLITK